MRKIILVVLLVPMLGLMGCQHATQIIGDSVVLPATRPANLLYSHIEPAHVVVRSTYLPGGTVYTAGKDYVLDPKAGTIARTENSSIPDYSKNILYEKKDFNHGQFAGYGNTAFTVFVDYAIQSATPLTTPTDYSAELAQTSQKLKDGMPLKVIAYGDSITAGGEATSVALQYPSRYVEYLRGKFPKSKISFENGATGGDTTVQGLERLSAKVLSRSPDLVLVAFGMNDHNIPGLGVPLPQFQANLVSIVTQIKSQTHADVILLSCFPPNPEWHFGSHSMDQYAHATQAAAKQTHSAYADVYGVWQKVLARKDAPSMLGNNINHPNDFGHWLYLQALTAIRF